jgi:outer membrane murein-binding lipoprotein Lpp
MATAKSPLEICVDILEKEVEGEKMVTRYILEQTRRNGDDLAILKTRASRVEDKVDGLSRDVGELKHDVDKLKNDVGELKHDVGELKHDVGALRTDMHGLRDTLPRMIADTMREVLAERDAKR